LVYAPDFYLGVKRDYGGMRIPSHIALIPDGNRRWARKVGLSIEEAYRVGSEKVKDVLQWALDLGVTTVTIYVLSMENYARRSSSELKLIYSLLKEKLIEVRSDSRIHENKVRVKLVGRTWLLPDDVRREAMITEKLTAEYSDHFLNLAVLYGGRQELVDAFNALLRDYLEGNVMEINEETIMRYLYLNHTPNPEPDLVIRTGGEFRVSNFLLYEIAYSEIVVLNKYWPEITREDFMLAIEEYSGRERRYGK